MYRKKLYDSDEAAVCFFRTTVREPYKKCLLQITERCNLLCEHCFVSSTSKGTELSYENIENVILPYFKKNKVIKVTLTGGEPLMHKKIYEVIELFAVNDISVTICSNGSLVNMELIEKLKKFSNVRFNISLDGFSNKSHNRFRNSSYRCLFDDVKRNVQLLSELGLLKGILITPNKFSTIEEYVELCKFAKQIGADYVLLNPLSEYGRGEDAVKLSMEVEELIKIKEETKYLIDETFEIVYIRFPNEEQKKLSSCKYGEVLYVFTDGNIAICPYMVFAANSNKNQYKPDDFYIGNIFNTTDTLDVLLDKFTLPIEKVVPQKCGMSCSRGCLAAKMANGMSIEDCDMELCPITFKGR